MGVASAPDSWHSKVLGLIVVALGLPIQVYIFTHPALLRRRLRAGPLAEKEPRQRLIMSLLMPAIAALVVVSLLDASRGWSDLPDAIAVLGDFFVAAGLALVLLVLRANQFAAGTVTVEEGQPVISTGPYALIRHPMYSGVGLLLLGIPLALGSLWGLIAYIGVLALIIWRLLDEERYLSARLPGYREYCAQVTKRLVPGLW